MDLFQTVQSCLLQLQSRSASSGWALGESRVRVIGTRPRAFPLARPVPARRVVQRTEVPYWQQQGWTGNGDEHVGYFRTPTGSWHGRATVSPSGEVRIYIKEPPESLRAHPHWPCFRWRLKGWYEVHHFGAADLSSAILAVEQILREANAAA